MSRADLRDALCEECGVRCVPGQSHLEHNAGWKKKLLSWDWYDVVGDMYADWDLTDSGHPPFVKLLIRNKTDKSSADITREFDDIAQGRFYTRDWTSSGLPFVDVGEVYTAGFWFQKREDAYEFVKRYGGTAE